MTRLEQQGSFLNVYKALHATAVQEFKVHCNGAQKLVLLCFLSAQFSTRVIQKIFSKDLLMCQLQNELFNIEGTSKYDLSQQDQNIETEKKAPKYSYTNIREDEIIETNPGDS